MTVNLKKLEKNLDEVLAKETPESLNNFLNKERMTTNETIAKEHQLKCKGCGKILDMRDPGQVLSHGWIKNGKIVCYEEEEVPHSGSQKKGEPIFWTKDKKPIDLN